MSLAVEDDALPAVCKAPGRTLSRIPRPRSSAQPAILFCVPPRVVAEPNVRSCRSASVALSARRGEAKRGGGDGSAATFRGFGKGDACSCGSRRAYRDCCGALHERTRRAQRAEDLMRARYSAYDKGLVDFIIESTHGAGDMSDEELSKYRAALRSYCELTAFRGLTVLKTERGEPGDNEGFVEFRVKTNGETYTERSRFQADEKFGWLYVRPPPENEPPTPRT